MFSNFTIYTKIDFWFSCCSTSHTSPRIGFHWLTFSLPFSSSHPPLLCYFLCLSRGGSGGAPHQSKRQPDRRDSPSLLRCSSHSSCVTMIAKREKNIIIIISELSIQLFDFTWENLISVSRRACDELIDWALPWDSIRCVVNHAAELLVEWKYANCWVEL